MKKAPDVRKLRASVRAMLKKDGPQATSKKLGVTQLAAITFAEGYGKTQQRTVDAISKALR